MKIFVPNQLNDHFIKVDLPQFYVDLVCKELSKPTYSYMLSYLQEKYHLNIVSIRKLLKTNYEIQSYENFSIISFNPNSQLTLKDGARIHIISIASLINDGNMEVKGTNIFTKIAGYIQKNMKQIHSYIKMKMRR